MAVLVDLAAALICFASTCHPVLVGRNTPRGEFWLTEYSTEAQGFGGNILVFKRNNIGQVYAIHRVIDVPGQQRLSRINSPNVKHRVTVTAGCVNVDPIIFDKLVECCSNSRLIIK